LYEKISSSQQASCSSDVPWSYGSELFKYFKLAKFEGMSGHIEFDSLTGYRKNLTLNIVDLSKEDAVDLVV
jgi:hypothetical protein